MSDDQAIVALEKQLSRKYSIDASQWWVGGFSQGGYLAAVVAVRHFRSFPGAVVIGAGDTAASDLKEYKAAAQSGFFYLCVGQKDPFNARMREFDRNLEAAGCRNKKFVELADVGHAFWPRDISEAGKWLDEAMKRVALRSSVRQKELQRMLDDAAKQSEQGAFADAVALNRRVVSDSGNDPEWRKRAEKATGKAAEGTLARAKSRMDAKDFDKARELLAQVIDLLPGTEWARKAADLKKQCP